MNIYRLNINGTNLNTNKIESIFIVASNEYILTSKYLKAIESIYVENWQLTGKSISCGNTGINAGAYLCETMEEITGFNLAY